MDIVTSLLQQDMFFAVFSYLTVGMACLLHFLYRERKWERELAQYQFGNRAGDMSSLPRHDNGTAVAGDKTSGPVTTVRTEDDISMPTLQAIGEMQVIAGEIMETEPTSPATPAQCAQHG